MRYGTAVCCPSIFDHYSGEANAPSSAFLAAGIRFCGTVHQQIKLDMAIGFADPPRTPLKSCVEEQQQQSKRLQPLLRSGSRETSADM